MLHTMSLFAEPFDEIRCGRKTVEVRLNDTKRQKVQPGDTIRFSRLPDRKESLLVRVTGRCEFPTFAQLYASGPPGIFGGDSVDQLLRETFKIYSPQQEAEFGVLGLHLELLPMA